MGAFDEEVDTTTLWKDAQTEFEKSYPKPNREYLQDKTDPRAVINSLRRETRQATQKSARCGSILERLHVITQIGDIAIKAAPESIGLAWAGFSLVFKMILLDSQTCSELIDAMDFFSEVVLVCELYGKRYLAKTRNNLPMKKEVLERIPKALSTVLEFSYLVQDFFKHSSKVRFIRNLFTETSFKLQSTMAKSKTECESLRHIDAAGFEEEMRRGSEQLKRVLDGLGKSLQSKLDDLNEKITRLKEQGDESNVEEEFNRNIKWFESAPIAELGLPRRRHDENLSKRQDKTCDWIFQDHVTEYQAWIKHDQKQLKSVSSGMLWLHGDGGMGKSMLVSTIISKLQDERGHLVVYFFCKLGDQWSQNGARIMLHLCAQLFRKGGENNTDMQREFNEVLNQVRDGLVNSDKEGASNVRIGIAQVLFEKLAQRLRKNVTIAVDGLDECVEDSMDFIEELKALAKSKTLIRVLVSSRKSPDFEDDRRILIDKSRTEEDIRARVTVKMNELNMGANWAIEKIVKKSEGSFKFAVMVTDGLKSGCGSLGSQMNDLPNTMNGLYLQAFRSLEFKSQEILVTVLRWLICRGDRIELQPIADELAEKYTSNKRDDVYPTLESVATNLAKVGRDFIKVSSNVVQLDHNSVRDFVGSWSRDSGAAGITCPHCGSVDQVDILSRVTGKEGMLMMAEHMLSTVSSSQFQNEFILLADGKSSSKRNGSKSSSAGKTRAIRYEVAYWYKHLRDAEDHWPAHERESEPRWHALYRKAEQFLSQDSKVYQDWWRRKNDIHHKVRIYDPPLYTAARYGLKGLMQLLIRDGHEVNVKNRHKNTPLHRVCMNVDNYCKSAELAILLKEEAKINEQNEDGVTPLLAAFKNSGNKTFDGAIKDLMDYKAGAADDAIAADPDITDKSQRSCLHYATKSHNTEACKMLLPASNEEVSRRRANLKDHHGETPLHWACKSNAPVELIKLLLERGADLKIKDNENQTAFYEACRVGSEAVARFLVKSGADIHDQDFKEDTALHEAVYSGNLDLVKFLTKGENGAKIDSQNKLSQTPLSLAASMGRWEIVAFLIDQHQEKGGNMQILSQCDTFGDTPLSSAVTAKNLEAVEKLLDENSVSEAIARDMCNVLDPEDKTPLHRAASSGSSQICEILVDRGAFVDANGKANAYGGTPLDAAFKGWQEYSGDDESRLQNFEKTVGLLLSKWPKDSIVVKKPRKIICAIWRGSASVCAQLGPLKNRTDDHEWICAVIGAAYGNESLARIISSSKRDSALVNQLLSRQFPTAAHGRKPSRWCLKNKHPALTLSKQEMVATFTSDDESIKEAAVFANHPVPAGLSRFYYEVKITKVGDNEGDQQAKVGIGFCTDLASTNGIPGSRAAKAPSWGYHGDTGKLFTRFDYGQRYKDKSGSRKVKTFKAGDTVGCGIDFIQGLREPKIFYTLNGHDLGVAFDKNVTGRLFPVVGAKSAGWEMRVNFGKEEFEWEEANKK